jgi:hypothetical protein
MRELVLMCLIGLLSGCCAIKESTTITTRDSTISFQPEPINLDTLLANYPYLFHGDTTIVLNCDTADILRRYGNFDVMRTLSDSVSYYRIQWDATTQRLRFVEQRRPIEKVVAIDNSISTTTVQKTPFMTILGYVACGMFAMMGFTIGLKGFKVI